MNPAQRLKVAEAKQRTHNVIAAIWDCIPGEDRADLGRIVDLLGEVLAEKDAQAMLPLFEEMEVTHE